MKLFDGKFCDAILPNRKRTLFKKKQILYEVGDTDRTLFFLLHGFVKVGTVTSDGHEVIYDVRKGGDVIGELCASEGRRPDRAVDTFNHQNYSIGLPSNNGTLDQNTNTNPLNTSYIFVTSPQFFNKFIFNGGSRTVELGVRFSW